LFEYRRRCAKNLLNQTWRDSFDAMVSTGEDVALPPVAWLCVQSYAYKAWHAAAALFDKTGSASSADILRAKARALAARVSESFWLDSEGCFAAGLDGAKRAIPMITSDCGHALWSGIAPSQHVAPIVRRVHRPDLMTSYGCRTLSSSSPFFAPFSYHRGNVWPFDNAILTMGLMNNGYEAEARALIKRVSAAIEKLGSPYELYVVLDRELFLQPRLRREHALLLRRPNQENRNMGWTAAGLAYMAAALASIQGTRLAFRDGYLRA
jgi:glycogen debranching enzyme